MNYSVPINTSLPIQNVSYKVKFLEEVDRFGNSKWMKDCMDSMEAFGMYTYWNNNTILRKNYDIVSGRFDINDYIDDFEVYDISTAIQQEMQLPGTLRHYDITLKFVNLLLGEYIKRPDIIRVVAKDVETSNEKIRIKSDLVWTYLQQEINREITQKLYSMGMDVNKNEFQSEEESAEYKEAVEQKYKELTPENIEKYMTYDFRSAGEHWGAATLSNDIERFRIVEQDQTEFYHMLVADRSYSHMYLTVSGYKIESWNPTQVFYQYNTQNLNIEDCGYVGRMLYMTKQEVISYLGHRMHKDQIDALFPEKPDGVSGGGVYKEFFNTQIYPFADWKSWNDMSQAVGFGQAQSAAMGQFTPFNPFGGQGYNYMFNQTDIVQVTQAYWKSIRKVGKLILQNPETGEIDIQIVDENFDPKLFKVEIVDESFSDSNLPNTICWTNINEVWEGVKININYSQTQEKEERGAIYIDIKPSPFQFRGNDPHFIWNSKLPVCGSIFNNINGASQSIVDLLKPYQILYNAFMNQAYQVGQKANGKFFVMGASLLPNIKDWGGEEAQEKFMTIATNLGLAVVDDSTSANIGTMQYGLKVMDMDESDRIQRLINLAMLAEQQGAMQLGISPQRQGTIQASETATATQAAVSNSYAVTETYFEKFNHYRRRKLQMLLELAQYVDSKGEGDIQKMYTTSDLGQAFIKIAKSDLLLRDIGVYLSNSGEEQRRKRLIEELLLKNNQSLMPLSEFIKTISLNNLTDIQKSLEKKEREQQAQAQQQEQAKMEHEQKMLQAQLAEKEKDRELKKYEIDTKANTELQKVTLQGIANESSFNPDVDLTDKLISERDIALKENQTASNNFLAQQQLVNQQLESFRKQKSEKEKLDFDKKLKESEQKNKKEIEEQKLQQIITQNKSQEKINKEANDAKIALADKQLEMKQLEKKMKEMEIANAKSKSNIELNHLKTKVEIEKDLAEVKAEAIELQTEAKLKEQKELSKLKSKEVEQSTSFKMEENTQAHKLKLKEQQEQHKEKLKSIKIKPKINKK
jgi:hypothetical protein